MSEQRPESITRWEIAEKLNGRVAMIGVTIAIITQLFAGSIW